MAEKTLNLKGLPPAPVPIRVLIQKRLGGHATSPSWLPEGLDVGLDDLRAEHIRLIATANASADAVRQSEGTWKAEDRDHAEHLTNSARSGVDQPADTRTPVVKRDAERARLAERTWAGVGLLAEHVETVVSFFRGNEDRILGELGAGLTDAEEKRRKAAVLLEAARRAEYSLFTLARWVKLTADDDNAFGQQPAPGPSPVPPGWQPPDDAFQRLWHERREWSSDVENVENVEAA